MRFRIFGTEIYISFSFCAVLSLMLFFDRTGLVIPTLLAVLFHEAGHLFAMWLLDAVPKAVCLVPASVKIIRKSLLPDKSTLIIAVLGPASNLIIGLTALLNYCLYKKEFIFNFAVINFALAVFNMLPVSGLDGGTALKILLLKKTDVIKAQRTVEAVTLFLAVLSVAAGIYLYLNGTFNLSVFIAALYFFICAVMGR